MVHLRRSFQDLPRRLKLHQSLARRVVPPGARPSCPDCPQARCAFTVGPISAARWKLPMSVMWSGTASQLNASQLLSLTQLGHWPVNDPEGGDRVRRHQARWQQDLALFIGEACYQKRQRTRPFRACELKWIAIQ